jgi:hypothetical protein
MNIEIKKRLYQEQAQMKSLRSDFSMEVRAM